MKLHYTDLTPDDFVFFRAGGKGNRDREQYPKVDEFLASIEEAWCNRPDKGKKHARAAFMKEHVFPVIRTAYFCKGDGSLKKLSPYAITEKVASKLRNVTEKKQKTKTTPVSRTPSIASSNSEEESEISAATRSNYDGASYVSGSDINEDARSEFSSVAAMMDFAESEYFDDDVGAMLVESNMQDTIASGGWTVGTLPETVCVHVDESRPAECSFARQVSIDSPGGLGTEQPDIVLESFKSGASVELTERLSGFSDKLTTLAKRTYGQLSPKEAEVEHLNDIRSMRNIITEVQIEIHDVVGRLDKKIKLANHQKVCQSVNESDAPENIQAQASVFDTFCELSPPIVAI